MQTYKGYVGILTKAADFTSFLHSPNNTIPYTTKMEIFDHKRVMAIITELIPICLTMDRERKADEKVQPNWPK